MSETLKIAGRRVAGDVKTKLLEGMLANSVKLNAEVVKLDEAGTMDALAVEVTTSCRFDVLRRLQGRLNACRAEEVKKEIRRALADALDAPVQPKKRGKKNGAKLEPDELDVIEDEPEKEESDEG